MKLVLSVLVVFLFLMPLQALAVPQEEAEGNDLTTEEEILEPNTPPEQQAMFFFRFAINYKAGVGLVITAWQGNKITTPPNVNLIYDEWETFGTYYIHKEEYNIYEETNSWTGFTTWNYDRCYYLRKLGTPHEGFRFTNRLIITKCYCFRFVHTYAVVEPVTF